MSEDNPKMGHFQKPWKEGPMLGITLLFFFFSQFLVQAQDQAREPVNEGPNFDARIEYNANYQAPPRAQQSAALEFSRGAESGLTARFNSHTGVTRVLFNRGAYLTEASKSGDLLGLAISFLHSNATALGLESSDLEDYRVINEIYTEVTGATRFHLQQVVDGLPVYNAQIQVNINRDGRIISVNNSFLPEMNRAANAVSPQIDAVTAVMRAAEQTGIRLNGMLSGGDKPEGIEQTTTVHAPGIALEPMQASLMMLPIRRGDARLVWNFQIQTKDKQHWYDYTVDAVTGQLWTRLDWVVAEQYEVYPPPIESPNHTSPLPPADARQVVGIPNPLFSPLGWHDTGSNFYTILRGNNVHAYHDRNEINGPPSSEPDCGPLLDCSFPLDLSQDPSTYTAAATTNLFYWNNVIHDIAYEYGFDEVNGNFQVNNFGKGGLGNDYVQAESQDGSGTNNAFMSTPTDGNRPRMWMFEWNHTSPLRDGSLDGGIISHEYGHGISNRLIGGPGDVNCLRNLQQMGEGLSDFWALAFTHQPGDMGSDGRGMATYLLGQPTTGPGLRPQRYSTDDNINSYTYESINSGISVPHGVGSVWAEIAWRCYWALIDEYGFDPNLYDAFGGAGNQRMLLYVMEGLKNTVCSPTFVDLRDGIIQAASDNFGGADVCILWNTFAAYGLGVDALDDGPNSLQVTNGFSTTLACADPVPPSPPTGLVANAEDGSVALDWADNSESDLASYKIYRGTSVGGPYTQIGNVSTSAYTDNSAVNGTTYRYVVTALDTATNESGNSNEASATPMPADPILTVNAIGPGSVILSPPGGQYPSGTIVTVTAITTEDFDGYSGDVVDLNPIINVTVTSDITIIANFSGPVRLATGVVSGVGSGAWTTVNLAQNYTDMVVVGIANYDNTSGPGAVRIQNASGNSFQVRVDAVGGAALSGIDVHWMAVEKGVYTVAADGVKMEAVKYLSTVTDQNNSWIGESQTYSNSYTAPIVLGQVMTYNDANFTTFWCQGSARTNPPDSLNLVTGKSVAEDTLLARGNETIGYIVIESGSGIINGVDYVAALGADSVAGTTDAPPYTYTFTGVSSPSSVVASLSAMDGGNGGWAMLYGASPLSATTLALAIDEDIIGDPERNHTTEQVAYIVFGATGPPPVTVPDVTGQTQAIAEANIVAANLVVGAVTYSHHATVPAGNVISQSPAGGDSVVPGSSVDIVVSLGTVMVTVPNVVAQSQATASSNITGAGLVVGVSNAYSASVPVDDVISQSPAGGTSVVIGSLVDIVVSLGVQPVTVPDVTGQDQATAIANIVAANLVVGVITNSYHATVPAGDVISQSPVGGVSVTPSSSVDLEVSLGIQMVTVPNVVALSQTIASSNITGAGLVVGPISYSYSASVPMGDVISQSPIGGSTVAIGSSVAIEVSLGPAPVNVPNVVGQLQAPAEATIIAAGLTVGMVTPVANPAPVGEVVLQTPMAGTSVAVGSAVDLTVSSGPAYESILQENASGGDKAEEKDNKGTAQSFKQTGVNYSVTKVVMYFSLKSGEVPSSSNVTFNIGTGRNSGAISGTIVNIDTSSISNYSEGSSFEAYEIVFAAPVALDAGTTYYLNLKNSSGNSLFMEMDPDANYGNGQYYEEGSSTGKDLKFQVWGY